ncbi:MAG: hypothetical protein HY763_12510 [Planctomycetes bacterium]|nr:hypothetical protein [Planctomycetota bacterium]
MRKGSWLGTAALTLAATATAWQLAGCQNLIKNLIPPQRIPFTFGTEQDPGIDIPVEAGVPQTQPLSISYEPANVQVGRGSFEIDPAEVVFTPADNGGGKGTAAFQDGANTIVITASIGGPDDLQTVCESGEQYPPFTLTLDENNQPVSIDPTSVTLTANTIALLNSGDFTICLELNSTISGTVTINSVVFTVGL